LLTLFQQLFIDRIVSFKGHEVDAC
jgi:hypothetical protein